MSLAVLASRALVGLEALPVRVEVHTGAGLPAFHIVGLPDTGVRESRERVRAAILNSGFEFPPGRVTVNLAPADLPKESGRFDLPIALGILLASGQIGRHGNLDQRVLDRYVFAGELSLTGAVMPITAPLIIALGVAGASRFLVLPASGAALAAHVPDMQVLAADTLRQVVDHLDGRHNLPMPEPSRLLESNDVPHLCMSDVRGQAMARRVLEIAASGRHSMLMSGPPGTGKSMLAQRLPGLLPLLCEKQALEAIAVASLCGENLAFTSYAPFRAPHHSATVAALVGGGLYPRPGEITRAHHGVLFLDELPEFRRVVIESLREPMEARRISISRAGRSLMFPAFFQLIGAMNPCPCGWLGHKIRPCTCTPDRILRYRERLSGPFLDRVDLQIALQDGGTDWVAQAPGEPSSAIRARVQHSLDLQHQRQGCANADLAGGQIDSYCKLDAEGEALLRQGLARWGWSTRVIHRILRVARTIADMAGQDSILAVHLAEAMQYRQAWPD